MDGVNRLSHPPSANIAKRSDRSYVEVKWNLNEINLNMTENDNEMPRTGYPILETRRDF